MFAFNATRWDMLLAFNSVNNISCTVLKRSPCVFWKSLFNYVQSELALGWTGEQDALSLSGAAVADWQRSSPSAVSHRSAEQIDRDTSRLHWSYAVLRQVSKVLERRQRFEAVAEHARWRILDTGVEAREGSERVEHWCSRRLARSGPQWFREVGP